MAVRYEGFVSVDMPSLIPGASSPRKDLSSKMPQSLP
jgi:hypothetical protein